MEPFLAIGELLKQRGHEVICLFPEQFRRLAEESGFAFASLGPEFLEMIESKEGKVALGGKVSGFKKIIAFIKLARRYSGMNRGLVFKQREVVESEKPERIVHSGKVTYPILWGLENTGKNVLISPVPYLHYVKNHTHLAFNSNYGTFLNKLTYSLARFGLVKTIMTSVKWLGISNPINAKDIRQALRANKTIYTISPTLFPRPDYWNPNIQVLGYHERNKHMNWSPDTTLTDFLNRNEKVLLVTFGSMTNPAPEEKTGILLEILSKNKIPALINTASGGLVMPETYDHNLFYFVSQIPYDWVLPKIYGVIHHGGSGTTHMALKYGCASLIIPHIIDQFVWNKLIFEKGAGPLGVRIDKITVGNLESPITDLINNTSYKTKSQEIATQMNSEILEEELVEAITR